MYRVCRDLLEIYVIGVFFFFVVYTE
jgi:hypothetical protein